MAERQYPFTFNTEASVDLAQDPELMQLMTECNFNAVFLGIETPDAESLALTKKFQNTRSSLVDSVWQINKAGLRVMAGFIIGFDGEKTGAGDRIIEFVEQTAIPTAVFGILQALPHTALWYRLEKEGRLVGSKTDGNQMALMNFIPTRPVEEIAREYVHAFCTLYEPHRFLDRVYRHFLHMTPLPGKAPFTMPSFVELRALAIVVWRQGVKRSTRWKFWRNLFSIIKHNPGVWDHYITVCAHAEHFMEYRQIVRDQVETQLEEFLANEELQQNKQKAALSSSLV
jgi:radical SAM superfamily enzyme YgiQ (UPF0313 family)